MRLVLFDIVLVLLTCRASRFSLATVRVGVKRLYLAGLDDGLDGWLTGNSTDIRLSLFWPAGLEFGAFVLIAHVVILVVTSTGLVDRKGQLLRVGSGWSCLQLNFGQVPLCIQQKKLLLRALHVSWIS